MKKALVLLLTLAMLATMVVGVSAADVTVKNAVEGQTYSAYKMLDYTKSGTSYVYTPTTGWAAFFATDAAKAYFTVTNLGGVDYVTLNDGKQIDNVIATAAKDWAEANSVEADATANKDTEYKFADLPVGYYLIDTTLGTLLALTHEDSSANVAEKNTVPTIEKFVSDTATVGTDKENNAAIGDTVYYKLEVTVGAGAIGYVITDTLSAGLTLNAQSIEVAGATKDTHYTLTVNGNVFEIEFKDEYLATLAEDAKIVVTFSAEVNEDAIIRGDKNPNEVVLEYNNGSDTDSVVTEVVDASYTKVDGATNNPLSGATFKLYDAKTGGNEISVVAKDPKNIGGTTWNVYRLAVDGETGVVMAGTHVLIEGLDADKDYWIEEVDVPAGYNKLNAREELTADKTATVNTEVENNAGTSLPETGGAGTVAFTVVGSLLMLAAVVLFTAKKKMSVQG